MTQITQITKQCQKSISYIANENKFSNMWFNAWFPKLAMCDCDDCERDVEWLDDIMDRKSDCEEEPQTECIDNNMCSVEGDECEYCNWEVECGDCEDKASELHEAIKERLNGNCTETNY